MKNYIAQNAVSRHSIEKEDKMKELMIKPPTCLSVYARLNELRVFMMICLLQSFSFFRFPFIFLPSDWFLVRHFGPSVIFFFVLYTDTEHIYYKLLDVMFGHYTNLHATKLMNVCIWLLCNCISGCFFSIIASGNADGLLLDDSQFVLISLAYTYRFPIRRHWIELYHENPFSQIFFLFVLAK